MASSDYWRKREEDWRKELDKSVAATQKRLMEVYRLMQAEIEEQVEAWYQRYADKEGMTLAQAKEYLSKTDIEHYGRLAKRYCEQAARDRANGSYVRDGSKDYFSKVANQEMRRYNTTMRVSKYQAISTQIHLRIANAQSKAEQIIGQELEKTAQKEYERQAGILGETVLDNVENAKIIADASFHGAIFSERIWGKHQEELQKKLDQALRNGLILGKNMAPFARELAKQTGVTLRESQRLLATEMSRVQVQTEIDSMTASGFDDFMVIVNSGCCKHCQELDGQHYKIEGWEKPGSTPPFHPNCRCTVAPYMKRDDDDFDEAAFDEWSETYDDHGLSWEEWQKRDKPQAKDTVPQPKPEVKAELKAKKEYTVDDIPELEKQLKDFEWWMISGEGERPDIDAGQIDKEIKRLKQLKVEQEKAKRIRIFQDLNRHMIESYGIEIDQEIIDRASYKGVKQFCDGIETSIQRFPEIQTVINRIAFDPELPSVKGAARFAYRTDTLGINPDIFSRDSSVEGYNEHERKRSFGIPKNVSETAIHECGHALEWLLTKEDKEQFPELWEARRAFGGFGKVAQKIISTAARAVRKTKVGINSLGRKKTINELTRDISGYATIGGNKECFAEAICDVIANGEQAATFSKEIFSLASKKYTELFGEAAGKVYEKGSQKSELNKDELRASNSQNFDYVGEINVAKAEIEKSFGPLNTNDVIFMRERQQHVDEGHKEFGEKKLEIAKEILGDPDYVYVDPKNDDTVLFVKYTDDRHASSFVLKLSTERVDKNYYNSILTMYIRRKKAIEKIVNRSDIDVIFKK